MNLTWLRRGAALSASIAAFGGVGLLSTGAAHAASVPAEGGNLLTSPTTVAQTLSPFSAAGKYRADDVCVYEALADNPHFTDPGVLQVHGYWEQLSGCSWVKANVTVTLQLLVGTTWKDEGSPGSGSYYPGGGRGKRATAQVTCANSNANDWRGFATADVPGSGGASSGPGPVVDDLGCGVG